MFFFCKLNTRNRGKMLMVKSFQNCDDMKSENNTWLSTDRWRFPYRVVTIGLFIALLLGLLVGPVAATPPHPTFDDNTFNALEAYFKAMMPTE